jgi:hypothetical protein
MKRFTLTLAFLMLISLFAVKAQKTNYPQINNGEFENWDNLGTATEEPTEWNSFKSASGPLAAQFGAQQIIRSILIRPGSTGGYSCLIWSRPILSIVANGNITTGQINMGSSTASDPSNFNISRTAQPAFSEALGGKPDSLVVWVRFKPANAAGNDSARIRATIHDNYDLKDPADSLSALHIVGSAIKNFIKTNNQWVRMSIPFNYTGPATSPDFILISMTTNKTPGGGSGGDSLYIDDFSLIYNPGNSIKDINSSENINVFNDASDIIINLVFDKPTGSLIDIYNMNGQLVYGNTIAASAKQHKINTNKFDAGIYLISILTETGQRFTRKIAVK